MYKSVYIDVYISPIGQEWQIMSPQRLCGPKMHSEKRNAQSIYSPPLIVAASARTIYTYVCIHITSV